MEILFWNLVYVIEGAYGFIQKSYDPAEVPTGNLPNGSTQTARYMCIKFQPVS
jgi:hypothetical protein